MVRVQDSGCDEYAVDAAGCADEEGELVGVEQAGNEGKACKDETTDCAAEEVECEKAF